MNVVNNIIFKYQLKNCVLYIAQKNMLNLSIHLIKFVVIHVSTIITSKKMLITVCKMINVMKLVANIHMFMMIIVRDNVYQIV